MKRLHYHRRLLKFSHSLSFTIVYKTAAAVVYILSLSHIRIQFLFCLSLDKYPCVSSDPVWSLIDYRGVQRGLRALQAPRLCPGQLPSQEDGGHQEHRGTLHSDQCHCHNCPVQDGRRPYTAISAAHCRSTVENGGDGGQSTSQSVRVWLRHL